MTAKLSHRPLHDRAATVGFTLITLLFGAVFMAPSASATGPGIGDATCPHGTNFTASACFYGQTNTGGFTKFANGSLTEATSQANLGAHINQTIWDYSGNCFTDPAWIEMGLTRGFHGLGAVYGVYSAYVTVSGTYMDHFNKYMAADNSVHQYLLIYIGSGAWETLLDGDYLYYASNLGDGGCILQTGQEVSNDGAGAGHLSLYHSDSFTQSPLNWRDVGGVWRANWNTSQFWVDVPCGTQGNVQPYCSNYQFAGAGSFSNSKP